jgi:hypothetical protein
MITVKTIIKSSLLQKLEILKNPKPLLRPVALDVVALMTERIHEKGEAADGSQIGSYNNQYLRLRQKKFKRSGDKKIIVSLTRQLENDWAVLATQQGWGIGFNNPLNAQKMIWVEEQKGKKIAALADSEKDYAINKLKKLIDEQVNN